MPNLIQPGRDNCATSGSPFLSFATMGKRPGRGAVMHKRMAQEAKYEAKRYENDSTKQICFNLVGSKPRLLSAGRGNGATSGVCLDIVSFSYTCGIQIQS